jgi:hypothetical protein
MRVAPAAGARGAGNGLGEVRVRRSWCLVAVLVACAPQARNGSDAGIGAGAPDELGSTLNVWVAADSVHFELHITNVTGEVVELEFATAQRYDFEVVDAVGRPVWRWSDDLAFAQVLGTEGLAPGESRRYDASWRSGDRRGDHVAVGRLVAQNYPVELRTPVELAVE